MRFLVAIILIITGLTPLSPANIVAIEQINSIDAGFVGGDYLWSPNGQWIAIGGSHTIEVYSLDNPEAEPTTLQFRPPAAETFITTYPMWFSENNLLVSVDDDVLVFDVTTGETLQSIPASGALYPVDTRFIASDNAIVTVWDSVTGEGIHFPGQNFEVFSDAVLYGDTLAVASFADDPQVTLWNSSTGEIIGEALTLDAPIVDLAFSTDGKRLISATTANTVQIFDVSNANGLQEMDTFSVDFGTDPRIEQNLAADLILLPIDFNTAQLYHVGTGEIVLEIIDAQGGDVVLSPNGQWVAYTIDPSVGGFSTNTLTFFPLNNPPSGINLVFDEPARPIAFSPNTELLMVQERNFEDFTGRFHFIDTSNGEIAHSIPLKLQPQISRIQFSPDGRAVSWAQGGLFCCGQQEGNRVVQWWGIVN